MMMRHQMLWKIIKLSFIQCKSKKLISYSNIILESDSKKYFFQLTKDSKMLILLLQKYGYLG